jgi:hypothetical protein
VSCTAAAASTRTARRAIEAFELDDDLLEVAAPPADVVSGEPVPADTRLDGTFTARALGVELPDLAGMLGRLKAQIDASRGVAQCRA